MKKFFWGFLLVFLNFHLNINQHSLNLLPDFAGYLLLFQGTKELEGESGAFSDVRPFTVGMAVYTAILWVGALLGVTSESGWLTSILNLIAMVVSLYIAWVLVQGVLEIENRRAADLNGRRLSNRWKGLAAVQAASKLLYLMQNLANVSVLMGLAAVLVIVGLILAVLFLAAWWRSAAAYETSLPRNPEGTTGPEEA